MSEITEVAGLVDDLNKAAKVIVWEYHAKVCAKAAAALERLVAQHKALVAACTEIATIGKSPMGTAYQLPRVIAEAKAALRAAGIEMEEKNHD